MTPSERGSARGEFLRNGAVKLLGMQRAVFTDSIAQQQIKNRTRGVAQFMGFGVSPRRKFQGVVLYRLRTPCVRGKTEEGLASVGLLVSEPRKMA